MVKNTVKSPEGGNGWFYPLFSSRTHEEHVDKPSSMNCFGPQTGLEDPLGPLQTTFWPWDLPSGLQHSTQRTWRRSIVLEFLKQLMQLQAQPLAHVTRCSLQRLRGTHPKAEAERNVYAISQHLQAAITAETDVILKLQNKQQNSLVRRHDEQRSFSKECETGF